jgi:hypothetical protein
MISSFVKRNGGGRGGRGGRTDAQSGNPTMGGHRGKAGYAIPYQEDTSRSPYRRGRRGR